MLERNKTMNLTNTHDLDECFCKMCDNLRDKVEGKKRAKTKIQTSKFIGINRKINCCSTKPLKSKRSKKRSFEIECQRSSQNSSVNPS